MKKILLCFLLIIFSALSCSIGSAEEGAALDATALESMDRMPASPEAGQPPFLVKAGVNGFIRGEGAGNFRLPVFSYDPGHAEGRFVYCIKPYAYWHPTDYLDIHVEGQGYGFSGSTQESGRFNLYQGFIEAKLPNRDWLALKVGRQEFSYGSGFMLSPNLFLAGLRSTRPGSG